MPSLYTNPVTGKTEWVDDEEYARIGALASRANQTQNEAFQPTGIPAYNVGANGALEPVKGKPQSGNTLRAYIEGPEPDLYGHLGQHAAATGVSAMAGAATYGVGGLWLTLGDTIMKGIHGDSWTPDKYQPITDKSRTHYLTEHLTPESRATDYSPMSSDLPGGNAPDQRLMKYLDKVQPYENMEYYNPKTQEGKMRAYGYSNWAKGRIGERWNKDQTAMEAQELAEKYGLELPDEYKLRGPFKADFKKGF